MCKSGDIRRPKGGFMKRILAALMLVSIILGTSTAWGAQDDRRIMNLMPEHNGFAHVSYSYNNPSEVKKAPGEKVGYHEIDVGGAVPIPITDNFIFSIGAQYYLHHYRLKNVTNYYNQNSGNVHFISLPMDAIFIFGDNWTLDVNFSPSLSSDLHEISTHDFQFLGGVIAGWAFSDIASLFFGVYVSKEFWVYLPYPIIGFVVRPGNFFELETVLPQYLRMNFKVADFAKLFLQGEFEGFVWDMEAEDTVPEHFLYFIDTRVGGGVSFKIIDGVEWEFWGGINPYREIKFRDRADQPFDSEQKMSWFAKTTISLTPALFKRK